MKKKDTYQERKSSYVDILPEDIGAYPPLIRELARDRAKICITCSNLSALDSKCVKCDCSYPKILLNSSKKCPINKW